MRQGHAGDPGAAEQLEQRRGIGVAAGEAGDAGHQQLGAHPGALHRGEGGRRQLRLQRLMGVDAAQQQVFPVLGRLHPHLHAGLARVDRENAPRGHAGSSVFAAVRDE